MHPEALPDKNRTIFAELARFKDFYLAGGTALALQIGHRISVDFDLFSEKKIDAALLDKVKGIFLKESFVISVNDPHELTVFLDGIKVTFLYYPFPVLLDFVAYEGANLLSIKEIAATKAYTLGRRGSFKDYIDLYFVFNERHSSLAEVIELAEKKYAGEFNSRLFLEQLIYFDDIEDIEIIFLKQPVSRQKMTAFLKDTIKEFPI